MSQSKRRYDDSVKIMLLGDSGVGKSSLVMRFVEDKFSSTFTTTLGVEFKQRIEKLDGKRICMQIWDTAGQEKFRTITTVYYRNVEGVVLTYDMCDQSSFDDISYWMDVLNENADVKTLKIVLVANKLDMTEKRVITREQGEETAKKYGIKYFEVSAKNKSNLNDVFIELTKDILQNRPGGVRSQKDEGIKLKKEDLDDKSSKGRKDKQNCCK